MSKQEVLNEIEQTFGIVPTMFSVLPESVITSYSIHYTKLYDGNQF